MRRVIDDALRRAIDEADLDAQGKTAVYELFWELLAIADSLDWLASATPADLSDPRLDGLRLTPGAAEVARRFHLLFTAELRAEAGRLNSPLHNRFVAEHVAETLQEVRDLRRDLAPGDSDRSESELSALSRLPQVVAELVSSLLQSDPSHGRTLLSQLVAEETPHQDHILRLIREPPSWLDNAPWETHAALGELAEAFGHGPEACAALQEAAARAGRARCTWLARAALSIRGDDSAQALELLTAAQAAAPDNRQERFLAVVGAVIDLDFSKLARVGLGALREGTPEQLIVAGYTAQGFGRTGRIDEAITILRPVASGPRCK